MSQRSGLGKSLRVVAIVLMALTSAFMLLGGAGTSCVAWAVEKYPSFRAIIPAQWLYQLVSVVTIIASLVGLWATVALFRGRRGAFAWALGVLAVGLAFAGAQMLASEALRGKSAPNNVRVYLTAFTLVIFLLLRLPPIWKQMQLEGPAGGAPGGPAAALAAILAGALILSVPLWAGPTHMQDGYNLVFVLRWPIIFLGGALVAGGMAGLIGRKKAPQPTTSQPDQHPGASRPAGRNAPTSRPGLPHAQ
jgi:hypothetical protein